MNFASEVATVVADSHLTVEVGAADMCEVEKIKIDNPHPPDETGDVVTFEGRRFCLSHCFGVIGMFEKFLFEIPDSRHGAVGADVTSTSEGEVFDSCNVDPLAYDDTVIVLEVAEFLNVTFLPNFSLCSSLSLRFSFWFSVSHSVSQSRSLSHKSKFSRRHCFGIL